jgi:hypothetical protein
MHGDRNEYKILAGKHERKRPLRKPGHRWRIILKWNLGKWAWGVNRINLAQDKKWCQALVNMVMNIQVP